MSRRWDASPVGKYKRDFDGDYLMNNINKRRGKKKKEKLVIRDTNTYLCL